MTRLEYIKRFEEWDEQHTSTLKSYRDRLATVCEARDELIVDLSDKLEEYKKLFLRLNR